MWLADGERSGSNLLVTYWCWRCKSRTLVFPWGHWDQAASMPAGVGALCGTAVAGWASWYSFRTLTLIPPKLEPSFHPRRLGWIELWAGRRAQSPFLLHFGPSGGLWDCSSPSLGLTVSVCEGMESLASPVPAAMPRVFAFALEGSGAL